MEWIPREVLTTQQSLNDDTSSLKRSTLTLHDKFFLRGTTTSTIFEGMGRRLRGSAGGIGCNTSSADNVADDEFAKSFTVDKIDVFLSHSWQANWVLKYFTLLLHFNAMPAVCGSMLVCIILAAVRFRLEFDFGVLQHDRMNARCEGGTSWIHFGTGCLVLTRILFGWHHVLNLLSYLKWCGIRRRSLFLDKVCIHQASMSLKKQGIKSIGSILSHSDTLLVLWDGTYFTRLWCTYELSAFNRANPGGNVVIVPITQGAVVAGFVIGKLISNVIEKLVIYFIPSLGLEEVYHIGSWSALPGHLFFACKLLEFVRDVRRLRAQLSSFSVMQAQCFCCKNNHRHPDTGALLPCDRQLVYQSIAYWQGETCEERGLTKFDAMIRTDFKDKVQKSMRGAALLPYHMVLFASLLGGESNVDNSICFKLPFRIILLRFFQFCCIRVPLSTGIVVMLVSRIPFHLSGGLSKRFFEMGVAIMSSLINLALGLAFYEWVNDLDAWKAVLITVAMTGMTWFLFFRNPKASLSMSPKLSCQSPGCLKAPTANATMEAERSSFCAVEMSDFIASQALKQTARRQQE